MVGESRPHAPLSSNVENDSLATPSSSRICDDTLVPFQGRDHLQSTVEKAVETAEVKERLSFTDILEVKFTTTMETESRKISDILDEKLGILHDLEVTIDTKLHQLSGGDATLETTTAQLKDLEARLDDTEQYSRRNSTRLLGFKSSSGEDTNQVAIDIAKRIGVDLEPECIDRSLRIPPPFSQDNPTQVTTLPIPAHHQLLSNLFPTDPNTKW